MRDILLGPGISCSDPGYTAPERDISLLGYPAPERDISLSRYPARNQDISLARSTRYPAPDSRAGYPGSERDIPLYLAREISRSGAGYLAESGISRSTPRYLPFRDIPLLGGISPDRDIPLYVRISRKVRSPDVYLVSPSPHLTSLRLASPVQITSLRLQLVSFQGQAQCPAQS